MCSSSWHVFMYATIRVQIRITGSSRKHVPCQIQSFYLLDWSKEPESSHLHRCHWCHDTHKCSSINPLKSKSTNVGNLDSLTCSSTAILSVNLSAKTIISRWRRRTRQSQSIYYVFYWAFVKIFQRDLLACKMYRATTGVINYFPHSSADCPFCCWSRETKHWKWSKTLSAPSTFVPHTKILTKVIWLCIVFTGLTLALLSI